MRFVRAIAIAVAAFELPVPVYWLILHAPVSFWRRHVRAAFLAAVAGSWGVIDFLIYRFRVELFQTERSAWMIFVGMALIGVDIFTFSNSEAALGGLRIVGHSELAGKRELIARGLYARVRHPRYLGMMAGVLGACLIVATANLWAASVAWLGLALVTIHAEERELRSRLGAAYTAYASAVPALLPFRRRGQVKEIPPHTEGRES